MRPGPIGPGNGLRRGSPPARPPLQCGPAQLGREMGARLSPAAPASPASMRPGPIGPGNASLESFVIVTPPAASMRPGPIGPGNAACHAGIGWRRSASMRPGPIGPGNTLPPRPSGRRTWLQCGPAQLGREIGPSASNLASCSSFNAARPNWAGKLGARLLAD